MNKKLLIGCGIVLVICLCCSSIVAIAGWAFNSMLSEGNTEKNRIVVGVCTEIQKFNNGTGIDQDKFPLYFTEKFREGHSYNETEKIFVEIFPKGTDCQTFTTANVIELIQKGQGLNVNTNNGVTTMTMTLKAPSTYYQFNVVKDDASYKIDAVTKVSSL
jgi:hypothetical protein